MLAARDLAGRATRTAVLALPESTLSAATAVRLRRSGWRVFPAATCDAVRGLVSRVTPEVVVLPADGSDESGWLTCAKLLRTSPRLRVILVGDPTADGPGYVRFVGAEAPSDPRAYHFEGMTTRTIAQVLFPNTVASGATVWLSACWVSARGQIGIACAPVSFTLQGGAVMPAAA